MSIGSTGGTPGISADPGPAIPTPKAPRLSSSTSSSLTVFVDTSGSAVAGADVEVRRLPVESMPRTGVHLHDCTIMMERQHELKGPDASLQKF